MKVIVLILALVLSIVGVQCDFKEDLHKIDQACRSESHVSEDDLKKFFKGETKDEVKDALKCHMKCVMEKQGHWSNGGFDSAAAIKQIEEMPHMKNHQGEFAKILDACKDKKGADECDTAFLITKCIVEHHNNGPM